MSKREMNDLMRRLRPMYARLGDDGQFRAVPVSEIPNKRLIAALVQAAGRPATDPPQLAAIAMLAPAAPGLPEAACLVHKESLLRDAIGYALDHAVWMHRGAPSDPTYDYLATHQVFDAGRGELPGFRPHHQPLLKRSRDGRRARRFSRTWKSGTRRLADLHPLPGVMDKVLSIGELAERPGEWLFSPPDRRDPGRVFFFPTGLDGLRNS